MFPIRIALSILEVWFSVTSSTIAARLFPESASARSFSLLTDISAVSLDEKNADSIKRITSMIS